MAAAKFSANANSARHEALRCGLYSIRASVAGASSINDVEDALTQVSKLLNLPLMAWAPDISYPYHCREAEEFSRRHGWPADLLREFYRKNCALKMPFYIRCRYQNNAFVSNLERLRSQRSRSMPTPEEVRIYQMARSIGVTKILTVPLHLPMGQIAMLTWAGDVSLDVLNAEVGAIEGDLIALGFQYAHLATPARYGRSIPEMSRVTPREWECLRMVARGYREAEIGKRLRIGCATVRFHINNVVEKFGCKNRTQALVMVAQSGALGPPIQQSGDALHGQ